METGLAQPQILFSHEKDEVTEQMMERGKAREEVGWKGFQSSLLRLVLLNRDKYLHN